MIKKNYVFIFFILAIAGILAPDSLWGGTEYLGDGALHKDNGNWDLPAQGTCTTDPNQKTRPDCLALRLVAASSGACTGLIPAGAWTTNGVCNDLDPAITDQSTCENKGDRKWNSGTGVCSIIMKGDDRNNVTCALHNGTWVTAGTCIGVWTMPAGATYSPPLLTGTGPGDQCLRCHNFNTQYNGPRVRDVENVFYGGHKNMARKVTPGKPWGGPPFSCSNSTYTDEQSCEDNGFEWNPTIYPSDDSGNLFNWLAGQINIGGNLRDVYWIYGDWLGPLPRVVAKVPASASFTCSIPLSGACSNPAYVTQDSCVTNGGTWTSNSTQSGCTANGGSWVKNTGASYTCARCHTTGWTSDATVNTAKEPEKSFPGIAWNRNVDAVDGQVNLAGGVAGDPNQSSSWDQFGITCNRCHSAAVNNTGAGAPYSAPTGMSSHHNNITAPDVGTGYCTDPAFTAQAQCDTAGAAWLTQCSVAGVCTNPAYTTSGACKAGGGTWTAYTTSLACTGAGGTWQATPACSVAGVCNTLDPAHNTQTLCQNAGGQWAAATDIVRCLDIHEFGKEHGIGAYEAARWTGSKTNRGQIITNLCMNCHRQETSGLPYLQASANAGNYDNTFPGNYIKVGPAHGTIAPVSHPHGNMFLNSPHAQFSGKFSEIATGTFKYNGTGLYKSHFMTDGEAANTGNGCTGCHDPHESVVPMTSPEPAIREECTECHAKSLTKIMHPAGNGTPMQEMATAPAKACESCHMPHGMHMFRINADAAYSTYPLSALSATVNANTAPDGNFNEAVWVDVDLACGQCHGGGTGQASTTGTTTANNKTIVVASSAGFVVGQRVEIKDAGALVYDDPPTTVAGDFESYVVSVPDTTHITLAGAPTKSISNTPVVQNPTKGGGYMTKATLANLSRNIHNDKPVVAFNYTYGATNKLQVNTNASGTSCSGSGANCDRYDWDWGDGSTGTGLTATHTYASAGTKAIKLTVHEYGVNEGSITKNVNVYATDTAPIVSSNFTWNPNTWTATVVDTSTDDVAVTKYTVSWGDGSVVQTKYPPNTTFTKTYTTTGSKNITHRAYDVKNQYSTETKNVAPAYFLISGTIKNKLGTANIASAKVVVKQNGTAVKTVYSASNGTFSAGSLKPGTYVIEVTKAGYTFAVPAKTVTVGPSSTGNTINATAP